MREEGSFTRGRTFHWRPGLTQTTYSSGSKGRQMRQTSKYAAAGPVAGQRPWLFKILNDGRAEEITTQVVRPGQSLPALEEGEWNRGSSSFGYRYAFAVRRSECISLHRIRGHTNLEQDMIRRAGIALSEGLWVRPVGCLTLESESDSAFEWVVPNRPMIQLEADFEVSTVELTIMKLSREMHSTYTRADASTIRRSRATGSRRI